MEISLKEYLAKNAEYVVLKKIIKIGDFIMEFYTKVAGVTFDNRQRLIRRMSVGERVSLVRDPYNPYDSNAIKVINSNGDQIGFIAKELASSMAYQMDSGTIFSATVSNITGLNPGENMGVNLHITY